MRWSNANTLRKQMALFIYGIYRAIPIVRDILTIRDATRLLVEVEQANFVETVLQAKKYGEPFHLATCESQLFSQNGEDGIIAEIFKRVGVTSKSFIEIGVGDGAENNTSLLLHLGWRGLWIEGDDKNVNIIRKAFKQYIENGSLRLVNAFVDAESAPKHVGAEDSSIEVDFLSLDIDQNTYWIWKSLKNVRARVVCVEYNAIWPPSIEWVVPYLRDRTWDRSAEFGASLKSLEMLGKDLGYVLVGCDLCGVNAFFVRSDLADGRFRTPFDAQTHYEPLRHFLTRRRNKYRFNIQRFR
jgi:hypothetical protein